MKGLRFLGVGVLLILLPFQARAEEAVKQPSPVEAEYDRLQGLLKTEDEAIQKLQQELQARQANRIQIIGGIKTLSKLKGPESIPAKKE